MRRGLRLGLIVLLTTAPAAAQDLETAPAKPGALDTPVVLEEPTALEAPAPLDAPTRAVVRAAFTSAILEREPVDEVDEMPNHERQIYFFTELKDFTGHTVWHRWEYKGESMGEIPFEVGGPRWRVWSSKELQPIWTGEWRVSVIDETGQVIEAKSFSYTDTPAVIEPPGVSEGPIDELPLREPELDLPASPTELEP